MCLQPSEQQKSEDFAAAALGYEVQIKQKVQEQNRKRWCRGAVLVCVIIVIVCAAVGLGIYFTDRAQQTTTGETAGE